MGRFWICAWVVLWGLTTQISGGDGPHAHPGFSTHAGPVRGITLSTHLDGQDWAWDGTPAAMARLVELGATWVAIHPYAAIGHDGEVRHAEIDKSARPEYLDRPIREAHRLGLKILIKPHLAYWGTEFDWRGEIGFDKPEHWQRFWRDYRRWIVGLASATTDADGFVVGTELVRSVEHEASWRRLIAEVRQATPAPLTYAANWSSFEQVGFWDALDAIGIQAYFPLTETNDRSVGELEIRQGWKRWMIRLRTYSGEIGRPVLFTELGYNQSFAAPVRPWEYRTDGNGARAVQQRCMRAALAAIDGEPAVLGAFLWKWFPEPHALGRNFQLATPGMIGVIRSAWGAGAAGTAP